MNPVDVLERKALFNLTRALALVLIALLVAALVYGANELPTIWPSEKSSHVDAEQLVSTLNASSKTQPISPQQPESVPTPLSLGVTLPPVIRTHFSGRSSELLMKFLATIPREERQDFLDNMGEVVVSAQREGIPVEDVIIPYANAKVEAIKERRASADGVLKEKVLICGLFISGLGLVALFSLVLVLLAIERNTRPVT